MIEGKPNQRLLNMASNLVLNVSPVHFVNAPLEVELFDYEDGEQLNELRHRHYQTHVFKRDQEKETDRIICVPLTHESLPLGGESDIIHLHDNLWLACTLIRNSLINYFHSLGRTVLDFLPRIKLVADGSKDELLSQSMLPGVKCPEWLSIRPLIDIDIRVFNLDERHLRFGLTLDLRSTRQVALALLRSHRSRI